jgi:hypothetical protein
MDSPASSSPHPAGLSENTLLEQCTIRRVRRSGPGGQNRNKVETGIQLVHEPTGLVAEANERRSQAQNRAMAIRRLRVLLAVEVRTIEPGARLPRPSPLWRSRCAGGRLQVNPGHADSPLLLAEALDILAAHGWDARPAAAHLGCSTSQLVRFLADEPRALHKLNERREQAGLRPLK